MTICATHTSKVGETTPTSTRYGAWKCPQQNKAHVHLCERGGGGFQSSLDTRTLLHTVTSGRHLPLWEGVVGVFPGEPGGKLHMRKKRKRGGWGVLRTDEWNGTERMWPSGPLGYEKSGAQFRQLRQGRLDSWYLLSSFHGPPLPASWEPPAPSSDPTACLPSASSSSLHPSASPWLWVA